MNEWDYNNGLPPLKKAKLHDEFEFLDNEEVYATNIDGFPYVLYDGDYDEGDKVAFHGEFGMYTVKKIDHDKKHIEFKMDKVLQLNDRTVEAVKSHYLGWGMTKEVGKVKANYVWTYASSFTNIDLVIDGKLSKNQIVQYNNDILKITDLIKYENELVIIKGEFYITSTIQPLYPYIKNSEVICWYEDMKDVYLRQVSVRKELLYWLKT